MSSEVHSRGVHNGVVNFEANGNVLCSDTEVFSCESDVLRCLHREIFGGVDYRNGSHVDVGGFDAFEAQIVDSNPVFILVGECVETDVDGLWFIEVKDIDRFLVGALGKWSIFHDFVGHGFG